MNDLNFVFVEHVRQVFEAALLDAKPVRAVAKKAG